MNKLYTAVMFLAVSSIAVAGGNSSHSAHSGMKAGSGVHFFGQLYVGFDKRSTGSGNSVDSIRDDGGKSRLGLKFKENLGSMSLVGHAEWKFDIADGNSTSDSSSSCNDAADCRTFDLHIGNLGFMTPLGYIGMGSFESPYKTMGMYDSNMDTALALNAHGATSGGAFGIAGTWDSSIMYQGAMGPIEVGYIRGMSSETAGATAPNVKKSDYALGVTVRDVMPGLELGIARSHDKSGDSNRGISNDKVFASYKVMPNLGAFYTEEEIEIAGGGTAAGDVTTVGLHYTMGNNMIQFVHAQGNMDAATTDYDVVGLSNEMTLSKSSSLTIGVTRKGTEGTDNAISTFALGLLHKF